MGMTDPSSRHRDEQRSRADRELYRQLRERNERRQRQRQRKLQELAEREAHHRPQGYRHPSR